MSKGGQLQGIQSGRGIAACLVAVYHTGRMLTLPQYVGHPYILTELFRFGNAGVDFFFVLSGFIIYYVHSGDIGEPAKLPHYLWQRVTRIYPIYWVVTAFVVATLLLKHDWRSLTPIHILSSILLLPGVQDPLLGVAWTLMHEIAFYAVFAILIFAPAAGALLAILDLALVTLAVWEDHASFSFLQSPYHYEFALGVLAAVALKRLHFNRLWLTGVVGLIGFTVAAWAVNVGTLSGTEGAEARFAFGGASCLIIIGISSAELRNRLTVPKFGSYLGAASYSIYLVHTLVIGWFARILFSVPGSHAAPVATAFLVLALSIGAGCAMHTYVEKPLQTTVRALQKGKSKAGTRQLPDPSQP